MPLVRFPPPWTIEELNDACFVVRDHDGQQLAYVHCAFDLLELDGKDLRRRPIEERKILLTELLHGSNLSIVLNEHFEEDGEIVFREGCKLGCEGIVSKRLGSIYRSGRSPLWLKVKNPNAPAQVDALAIETRMLLHRYDEPF